MKEFLLWWNITTGKKSVSSTEITELMKNDIIKKILSTHRKSEQWKLGFCMNNDGDAESVENRCEIDISNIIYENSFFIRLLLLFFSVSRLENTCQCNHIILIWRNINIYNVLILLKCFMILSVENNLFFQHWSLFYIFDYKADFYTFFFLSLFPSYSINEYENRVIYNNEKPFFMFGS